MRKLLLTMALSLSANAFAGGNLCENVVEKLGETPDALVRSIGQPASKDMEKVNNLHDPEVIDSIITLNYPTGFVSLYHGSSLDKYILLKARLGQADFPEGLKAVIPTTTMELIRSNGQPDSIGKESIRYYCGESGEEWVDVFRKQNAVTGFEFVAYFDG